MSLLDALNEVKKSGFDPKKGKEYNAYEAIPPDTYLVTLDNVTHNAKGDRDFLMITFSVLTGKYAGKKESIFPTLAQTTSTGKPMPNAVLARSISMIQIIGAMAGIEVPDSCFAHENETEAYEDIKNVLKAAEGKTMKMTIKETPNKKNPDRPYRNYNFAPAEQPKAVDVKQDPFAAQAKDPQDISDDDLPFD